MSDNENMYRQMCNPPTSKDFAVGEEVKANRLEEEIAGVLRQLSNQSVIIDQLESKLHPFIEMNGPELDEENKPCGIGSSAPIILTLNDFKEIIIIRNERLENIIFRLPL